MRICNTATSQKMAASAAWLSLLVKSGLKIVQVGEELLAQTYCTLSC